MPRERLNLVQTTAGHTKNAWLKAPGLAAELGEAYLVLTCGLTSPLCPTVCTDVLSYKHPASTGKVLEIEHATAHKSDK